MNPARGGTTNFICSCFVVLHVDGPDQSNNRESRQKAESFAPLAKEQMFMIPLNGKCYWALRRHDPARNLILKYVIDLLWT